MIRLDNSNNLGIGFEFMTSTKLTGAHESAANTSGKKQRNLSNHIVVEQSQLDSQLAVSPNKRKLNGTSSRQFNSVSARK